MRRPPVLDPLIAQTKRVTNGAVAMQTVRCGHRAGISGSFHETLATDRPHMRQQQLGPTLLHENSAKWPFWRMHLVQRPLKIGSPPRIGL